MLAAVCARRDRHTACRPCSPRQVRPFVEDFFDPARFTELHKRSYNNPI